MQAMGGIQGNHFHDDQAGPGYAKPGDIYPNIRMRVKLLTLPPPFQVKGLKQVLIVTLSWFFMHHTL